jgi:ferredoxin-NADP reductase
MAIVRKHRCRVSEVRQPLPDVCLARLESLDRPFQYRPGQFLHLALEAYDPSQPWPESRCFSIQTPPATSDRILGIAYSIKGAFTRRMADELRPGRELWLKLPYGDLFGDGIPDIPCVFLAGGTGVTPFLSLFLDPAFRAIPRAALYLGVRTAGYHLFAPELATAQAAHPHFDIEVIPEDRQGRIPLDRVLATHGSGAIYLISGPPAMIRGFRDYFLAAGVPSGQIRTDDWE